MTFELASCVPDWFGLLDVYRPVILFLAGGFACTTMVSYLTKLPAKRKARQQARRNCIHCGYDLRATPHRCPECGHPPTRRTVARGTGAAAHVVQRRSKPIKANPDPLPFD
jgi:predicted RNA-binding Zn-ribbon protein involved in translation (DUF1610 family)